MCVRTELKSETVAPARLTRAPAGTVMVISSAKAAGGRWLQKSASGWSSLHGAKCSTCFHLLIQAFT